MKIGINRWTMPAQWSLAECFEAAHEAGFESIEINLEAAGELNPDITEDAALRIRRSAEAARIELSGLSTGLGWSLPLTSNDPAVRARGVAATAAQIRIAAWMGLDAVLCVPGVVTDDVSYDTAYTRAQAALRDLVPAAQAARVMIGVENVWNKFLLSPLEMARFVDELDSPWVQVYFDVGNVLVFGYPQHWIRILGKRIVRVHVKDFRTGIGNITGFCNLLQGDVPWKAVREALAEVGYTGHVTAEVEGYRNPTELGLKHIAECLRAGLGG